MRHQINTQSQVERTLRANQQHSQVMSLLIVLALFSAASFIGISGIAMIVS